MYYYLTPAAGFIIRAPLCCSSHVHKCLLKQVCISALVHEAYYSLPGTLVKTGILLAE